MIPTVAEERALALRRPVVWRRLSILVQAVLFLLTLAGIAAFDWFNHVLQLPEGWVTAIGSIALAEALILHAHFWRTGVESALWLGGLLALIFSLPGSGKPEAVLLFVAAAAVSGWRVRNALFGAAAPALFVVYLVARDLPWIGCFFAMIVALGALLAELRGWQRPSTEFFWEVALVVMPVAGYAAVKRGVAAVAGDLRVVALFAVLAAIFLAVGIRFRLRIVLLAAVVTIALVAIEMRARISLSDEMVLIVAGAIVLLAAAAILHALRGRETGFVLTDERHELDEALQLAAMLPLAAPAAPPASHTPTGGGQFGGAGAGGDY